jgi:catechol 2,3-dioxygenase
MEAAAADQTVAIDGESVFKPAIHHVNLKTTRLPEMIDWYCRVLGMKANFAGPMGAFLTNDGANHRIALTALPAFEPDPDRLIHDGMHHTAFEYRSLDELLGTYVRLGTEGINPHVCVDHGLTTSFYYADPDGNSVELQVDNYGDWSKSTEFISSDPRFVEDPIGKLLDPDRLVEARHAGAELWEIHQRAYAGEFPPSTPPDMRMPLPPPPA